MEFVTNNSKKSVKINPASFQDAMFLKKEAMKCLTSSGALNNIDINNLSKTDVKGLFDSLANLIVALDTSNGFENAVFKCLERCIYDNKHAITRELFDDRPELREDYYEIVSKCCEVNLSPFFKSLTSVFSTQFANKEENNQEQA